MNKLSKRMNRLVLESVPFYQVPVGESLLLAGRKLTKVSEVMAVSNKGRRINLTAGKLVQVTAE